jgi:hypothetical protein
MKNKEANSPEKWKPKYKWIESMTVNLKKSKKAKYKYYIPKTQEEEKEMEGKWNAKMEAIFNIIFPEGAYTALENFRKNNKPKNKPIKKK